MAHLNATLFFKKANLQEFKGQSEKCEFDLDMKE